VPFGVQGAPDIFLKFLALEIRCLLFFNRKSKTGNRKLIFQVDDRHPGVEVPVDGFHVRMVFEMFPDRLFESAGA
jgi:hypothetical protein